MHCAFEGHVGAAIVEVDAWVAHAWETEAWLAEQGADGCPDEMVEEVRVIAAWIVSEAVRQQWSRDEGAESSKVAVVYRVIAEANGRLGRWSVRGEGCVRFQRFFF